MTSDTGPKGDLKPLEAPIIVERIYQIAGKRVTFHVVFPAALGRTIGLENVYQCAQAVVVRVESKNAPIKEVKRGQ